MALPPHSDVSAAEAPGPPEKSEPRKRFGVLPWWPTLIPIAYETYAFSGGWYWGRIEPVMKYFLVPFASGVIMNVLAMNLWALCGGTPKVGSVLGTCMWMALLMPAYVVYVAVRYGP